MFTRLDELSKYEMNVLHNCTPLDFNYLLRRPRAVLYHFVKEQSGLQLLQMPLSCSQLQLPCTVNRTYSNVINFLSDIDKDVLQRIQLMPTVAFSRESFGVVRASDSLEHKLNALALAVFACLSDWGIPKLGEK